MRNILECTSAPMQKLIDLAENRRILVKEIETYHKKFGIRNKIAGKD